MEMQELIEALANWFDIEPDEETGEFDLEDYDWQAGCYINEKWFSLAEVVKCIEQNI